MGCVAHAVATRGNTFPHQILLNQTEGKEPTLSIETDKTTERTNQIQKQKSGKREKSAMKPKTERKVQNIGDLKQPEKAEKID